MKSPGTGSMILSMYKPIFEEGACIGYMGAGVFASHLMDALLDLDIKTGTSSTDAAVSEELSTQARTLNVLISRSRIS